MNEMNMLSTHHGLYKLVGASITKVRSLKGVEEASQSWPEWPCSTGSSTSVRPRFSVLSCPKGTC